MTGTPHVAQYALPFDIHICVSEGHTSLSSRLHEQLLVSPAIPDDLGMVAICTIESLLLAMAQRGVSLNTPEVSSAVVDAVEAIAEYLACT